MTSNSFIEDPNYKLPKLETDKRGFYKNIVCKMCGKEIKPPLFIYGQLPFHKRCYSFVMKNRKKK